ncbi:MAG: NAD(P)-binding protein [Solirubrobacteraceae bacterium]|nr:MAG: hypothetical protein DLM63_08280 [Solirubrobacterales bacterium]
MSANPSPLDPARETPGHPPTEDVDVLVLGAGLGGLAVAAELGEQAVVLEREERPGGIVKTESLGGFGSTM